MASEFYNEFCVVDLETLAKSSRAAILSLGLTVSSYQDKGVTFESLIKNGLYLKFDLKEQLIAGRVKEDSTIAWWYEQDAAAKKVLKPSAADVSVFTIKERLEKFFDEKGLDIKRVDVYDRNSFDVSKMQDVIETEPGAKVPWDYKHVFEISTMLRYLGFDRYAGMRISDIPGAVYHNSLHDAAGDHLRIMKALHSVNS